MGWGYAFGAGLDSFAKMVAEAQARAQAHQDQLELLGVKAKLTGMKGAGAGGGDTANSLMKQSANAKTEDAAVRNRMSGATGKQAMKGSDIPDPMNVDARPDAQILANVITPDIAAARARYAAETAGGSLQDLGAAGAADGRYHGALALATRNGPVFDPMAPNQGYRAPTTPGDFASFYDAASRGAETQKAARGVVDALKTAPAAARTGALAKVEGLDPLVQAEMAPGIPGLIRGELAKHDEASARLAGARASATAGPQIDAAKKKAEIKDTIAREKDVRTTVSNVVADLTATNNGIAPTDDEVKAALPDLSPEQIAAARATPQPTGRTTPVGVAAKAADKAKLDAANRALANARHSAATIGKGAIANKAMVGAVIDALMVINGKHPSADDVAKAFAQPFIEGKDAEEIIRQMRDDAVKARDAKK